MPAPVQPPTRPPAALEPRAWVDFERLEQPRREERMTIGAAIALTLLLHGSLFFWVIPWIGNVMAVAQSGVGANAAHQVAPPPVVYDLVPATPDDQKAIRFLEANPNAPVAKPAPTNLISSRDQHAAQPDPDPNSHSNLPSTSGNMDNTAKIVAGDLNPAKPQPSAQPNPSAQRKPSAAETSPPPTAPPPTPPATQTTTLQGLATTNNGEGVRVLDKPSPVSADHPPVEIAPLESPPEDYHVPPGPLTPQTVAASAASATPLDRPTSPIKVHDGPIMKNTQGAHDKAMDPAADTRWTPFGAYLQMMFEAIGSEWDNECGKYSFDPRDSGSAVVVMFVVNSAGQIEDAQVEESSATRGATLLCLNAISHPAPYGKWTADMVGILGDKQTIRVTFYYQ